MNLPCDKCAGTGNMELPPALSKTFKIIEEIAPCYFVHIYDRSAPLTSGCVANRIKRLINMGLVLKSEDLRYTTKKAQQ